MPPFFRDKIRPKCHAFRSKTYMYFYTYIPELLPYLPGSHIPDNTFPKNIWFGRTKSAEPDT